MIVSDIVNCSFVNKDTLVYIRDGEFNLLACDFPAIIRYWQSGVKAFSWNDSNLLYITIREGLV